MEKTPSLTHELFISKGGALTLMMYRKLGNFSVNMIGVFIVQVV